MGSVEMTSPVGRLTLRQVIEDGFKHLYPFAADGFKTKCVLLDPADGFQVHVDVPPDKQYGATDFWVALPLADIIALDGSDLPAYLILQFVEHLPDSVRQRCSDALDVWAMQLGKATREELWRRPPMPTVEGAA